MVVLTRFDEAGVAQADHTGQTAADQQRAPAAPDPARDSIGVEPADIL
jgi:hypothetical protein